jgi:hypothetical protein
MKKVKKTEQVAFNSLDPALDERMSEYLSRLSETLSKQNSIVPAGDIVVSLTELNT